MTDQTTIEPQMENGETPPAPMMPPRRSLAYLIGALAGGNLLDKVFRLIGGLLQTRYILPEALGAFNGIGLVLGFGRFLQLGVMNGLNRELPYYFGRKDVARVHELAAAAQAWALILGATLAVPFAGVGVWHLLRGDWAMAVGWGSNSLLALIFFYVTMYLPATYRTASDFARLATANVIQSAVALALVATIALWGFYGLCLRATIPALIGLWILRRWQPIDVRPKWSLRHLRHLLIVGLPIFAVGELGGSLWVLVDQRLVQHYLDDRGLGLYYLVVVVGSTVELLPQSVSQVLYPRMAEHYGRTHDLWAIIVMNIRPTLLLVASMLPVVVLGWWLARPLTKLLLPPNWVDAVPAAQWSLLPALALSFCCVFNVYNVVKRQDLYGIVILLSFAGYFGTLMWLIRNGPSLVAFPQAMLVGRIVYAVAGFGFLIPTWLQHRNDMVVKS